MKNNIKKWELFENFGYSDRKMINECLSRRLYEGAESKNMSSAKHYLYDNFEYDEKKAMDFIGDVKSAFPNCRLKQCKFVTAMCRMIKKREFKENMEIFQMNQVLKIIADEYADKFDRNLNGESPTELIKQFWPLVQKTTEKQKKELASKKFTLNPDYKIIRINSFEESYKFHNFNNWCVCIDWRSFMTYSCGIKGNIFFIVKKGFENIEKPKDESNHLDEYGTSLIEVSLYPDGTANTIISRYNNKSNDMTVEELSELIGRDFYKTFTPGKEKLNELETFGQYVMLTYELKETKQYASNLIAKTYKKVCTTTNDEVYNVYHTLFFDENNNIINYIKRSYSKKLEFKDVEFIISEDNTIYLVYIIKNNKMIDDYTVKRENLLNDKKGRFFYVKDNKLYTVYTNQLVDCNLNDIIDKMVDMLDICEISLKNGDKMLVDIYSGDSLTIPKNQTYNCRRTFDEYEVIIRDDTYIIPRIKTSKKYKLEDFKFKKVDDLPNSKGRLI